MVWHPLNQRLKRLLEIVKESDNSSRAVNESSTPRQLYIVYYDDDLNVVEKEWATYELHLYNSHSWEWKVIDGTQEQRAHFLGGGSADWSAEEWAQFPYNIISGPIKRSANNPQSGCGFAFRWINSDWHTRYRMFLSTHRGSLDSC